MITLRSYPFLLLDPLFRSKLFHGIHPNKKTMTLGNGWEQPYYLKVNPKACTTKLTLSDLQYRLAELSEYC